MCRELFRLGLTWSVAWNTLDGLPVGLFQSNKKKCARPSCGALTLTFLAFLASSRWY